MNANRKQRFAALPRIEAHEVGRPRFRVGNPIVAGAGDFEVQPIYDYYGVAAATATGAQRMFQVSQGQNHVLGGLNIIKTALHTSMTTAGGVLPNPERILVRCVCVFLDNRMNQVDVNRILSESLFQFVVGSKVYAEDVLAQCGGGGGSHLQSTFASASAAGSGMPYSANGYKLNQSPYGAYVGPDGAWRGDPSNPMSVTFPGVDGVVIEQGQRFFVAIDPTLAQQYNAAGVGFTTGAAGLTPAGIGISLYFHIRGTQLIEVQ